MKIKEFISSFVIIFILTLVVSAIVSFLYNLIVHGVNNVDWETSFRMGFILAIIIPLLRLFERK